MQLVWWVHEISPSCVTLQTFSCNSSEDNDESFYSIFVARLVDTGFTSCTKSCGSGRQMRMIKINRREYLQSRRCNTQPCPSKYTLSPSSHLSWFHHPLPPSIILSLPPSSSPSLHHLPPSIILSLHLLSSFQAHLKSSVIHSVGLVMFAIARFIVIIVSIKVLFVHFFSCSWRWL